MRRGSASFEIDPRQLRNPGLARHLLTQAGGSRGRSTEVPVDLRAIRERAVTLRLWLDALGDLDWRSATGAGRWRYARQSARVPGRRDRRQRLVLAGRPERGGTAPTLSLERPGVAVGYVPGGPRHCSPALRADGAGWSGPRLFDAELRAHHAPLLMTTPSYAVELCRQASEQGRELHGARFLLVSEPCTAARRAAIERVGGIPLVRYASTEIRPIGYGCLAPSARTVHIVAEQLALIRRRGRRRSRAATGRDAAHHAARHGAVAAAQRLARGPGAGVTA